VQRDPNFPFIVFAAPSTSSVAKIDLFSTSSVPASDALDENVSLLLQLVDTVIQILLVL